MLSSKVLSSISWMLGSELALIDTKVGYGISGIKDNIRSLGWQPGPGFWHITWLWKREAEKLIPGDLMFHILHMSIHAQESVSICSNISDVRALFSQYIHGSFSPHWSIKNPYVFSWPASRLAFGDYSILSVPKLPVSS